MLFLPSSALDKVVGYTEVRGLRISKFLEMGEYQLSFFLPGGFVCVMKIVYGMSHGHYQFRLKDAMSRSPLRKVFPARENLNCWIFSVFEGPAICCWSFPMAGGLGARLRKLRWFWVCFI